MVLPLPAAGSFLSGLGGLLGGGSKATASTSVATNINASIANVIGAGASTGPTTGGGASSTPNLIDGTQPATYPGFLSGGAVTGEGTLNALTSGAVETSIFDNPMMIAGIAAAALGAIYFLSK